MPNPTIRQRLSFARSIVTGSAFSKAKRQSGKFPLVWPNVSKDQPVWRMTDFASYVGDGFNINSLIYSAIMYKVRAKWSAPLRAYTGTRDQPELADPSNSLAQLIARPNPYQSQADFEAALTAFVNIAGDAYALMHRTRTDELPEAMYTPRPDRIRIVVSKSDKRRVVGYLYVPEGTSSAQGTPILPQDLMHIKFPNPLDPLDGLGYGLSPMSAIAQSANVDNDITTFLKDFFDKGAMLPGLLKFSTEIDDRVLAQVKRRWMEMYGGSENWTDIGVLDSGGDYQRLGLSFDEMGFESLDERNESRILSPFGVPPILIGTRIGLMRSTYSNYEQARQAFWEDTFVPELDLFGQEWGYHLHTPDGTFVQYDLSRVPALQAVMLSKVDAAKTLWSMGVPSNQALDTVGLRVGDIPGGDIGRVPLNLVPTGASVVTAVTEPGQDEASAIDAVTDERDGEKFWLERAKQVQLTKQRKSSFTDEQKATLYKQVDGIAQSWEGQFAEAVIRMMRLDLRNLLAAISDAGKSALALKQTVDFDSIEQDWQGYYQDFADEQWRNEFMPLMRGVVNDQGEAWGVALGMQWDIEPLDAIDWFQDYTLKFAQPIIETTLNDLHKLITQALEEGWSIPQLSKQLELVFDRYLDPEFTLDGRGLTNEEKAWFEERSPRFRRDLISRTETIRASNSGTVQIFSQFNIALKEWLATPDSRTRDSHISGATNGQIRAIDEPFNVNGSELMYPGDASMGAPASEWAQCRCTILPVIEADI